MNEIAGKDSGICGRRDECALEGSDPDIYTGQWRRRDIADVNDECGCLAQSVRFRSRLKLGLLQCSRRGVISDFRLVIELISNA